jgi:uncharacterized protein (DUF4415 family)
MRKKTQTEAADKEFAFDPSKMKRIPREQRRRIPPEAFEPRNIKVMISLRLDSDVLEYFKARAAEPGAAPYQTQINNALRRVMEGGGGGAAIGARALLEDEGFLDAVAERVAERSGRK